MRILYTAILHILFVFSSTPNKHDDHVAPAGCGCFPFGSNPIDASSQVELSPVSSPNKIYIEVDELKTQLSTETPKLSDIFAFACALELASKYSKSCVQDNELVRMFTVEPERTKLEALRLIKTSFSENAKGLDQEGKFDLNKKNLTKFISDQKGRLIPTNLEKLITEKIETPENVHDDADPDLALSLLVDNVFDLALKFASEMKLDQVMPSACLFKVFTSTLKHDLEPSISKVVKFLKEKFPNLRIQSLATFSYFSTMFLTRKPEFLKIAHLPEMEIYLKMAFLDVFQVYQIETELFVIFEEKEASLKYSQLEASTLKDTLIELKENFEKVGKMKRNFKRVSGETEKLLIKIFAYIHPEEKLDPDQPDQHRLKAETLKMKTEFKLDAIETLQAFPKDFVSIYIKLAQIRLPKLFEKLSKRIPSQIHEFAKFELELQKPSQRPLLEAFLKHDDDLVPVAQTTTRINESNQEEILYL